MRRSAFAMGEQLDNRQLDVGLGLLVGMLWRSLGADRVIYNVAMRDGHAVELGLGAFMHSPERLQQIFLIPSLIEERTVSVR